METYVQSGNKLCVKIIYETLAVILNYDPKLLMGPLSAS